MGRRKRSASGQGSIRQRSDGRWEGRFTTGYDPLTGKQITRSVYGSSQAEVRQKLTAISAQIDSGEYTPPTKLTVGQWLDIFITEYSADLKYNTVKTYRGAIENYLKPFIGTIRLSDVSPVQVQMLINRLSKPKKGKALSPKTVQLAHRVLSKAMNTAVRQGLLKNNPAANATLPRVPKVEVTPLTNEQVKDFLKICTSDVFGNIMKILLFTGMRESEALGLTWDNIDFERNTIKLNKQLLYRNFSDGGYTFSSLKNDKPRTLTVAPFVMEVLRQQQNRQILDRLAAGEAWQGWQSSDEMKISAVFLREDGSYMNRSSLYRCYKRIAAQIGAPESTVHDLRHTYACLALQNEDSVKTVQAALGHASAGFTLDVYGHVSEKMRQESADRMQKYIDSAMA